MLSPVVARGGHGHGMYWSGNMLVVATGGSVLRVFDLRHIWRTDTSTGEVGLGADGKFFPAAPPSRT